MNDFQKELSNLINKHSLESESDTPDFILANYLKKCLDAFEDAVNTREQWYGRVKEAQPCSVSASSPTT